MFRVDLPVQAEPEWRFEGIELRDHFAAHIISGLLASDAHPDVVLETLMDSQERINNRVRFAYRVADAMLAERAKGAK